MVRCDLLLQLADFLEKLPEERFNYEYWVSDHWDGQPDLSCGTAACAFGWACTFLPGLSLKCEVTPDEGNRPVVVFAGREYGGSNNRYTILEAAAKYFELPYSMARWLFLSDCGRYGESHISDVIIEAADNWWSPDDTATASEVAQHIRRVVRLIQDNERENAIHG